MPRPPSPLDELPAEETFEHGGVALNGRRLGRGPRVVLLHGGPGLDHHVLLPLALSLRGVEVLVPDLPGHGASTAGVPGGKPDLPGLLDATERWLRGQPRPSLLAGHSLGAYVVEQLVVDRRVPVGAAALVCPPGRGPARSGTDRPPRARDDARSLRSGLLAACRAEERGPLSPAFVEAVDRCRLRPPADYATLLSQLHRALARPASPRRAPCPIHVLAGGADGVVRPETASALHALLAGSHLHVLEGAGHFPFAHDAGELARRLEGLCDRALGTVRPQPRSPRRRRRK